jgi:prohibitin 2
MAKSEEELRETMLGNVIKYGIFALVIFSVIFSTVYTIPAGSRGVITTFGAPDMTPKSEGIGFKIPFVQNLYTMSVQTQKYEADLTAASRDLQDVQTKIAINYRVSSDQTAVIYRDIGMGYADKIIYPLEQEINKATTAKFTAEELITKRDAVRSEMKSKLGEMLLPRGIIVEEISIIDFKFSPSFTQAIELKVTAEQNALAAKNKLAQVEYEAQQRVTQAEGEATAIKIQAEAINKQGGAEYVRLQAITRWNGVLPTVTGGVVPFIDVSPNGE